MTCRARGGRSARASVLAATIAVAVSLVAMPAPAQTQEELKAARELFQEAFKDEQEQRLPEALEKFQRVAKVKESASVRYRIATVLAAMGRWREARDMYRALAAARPSLPPNDYETSDSAAEKAAELDRRIPRLALRIQDNPPAEARVTLDGAPVPVSTTPRSIELDPGEHVIAASSSRGPVIEHTVTLPESGGEVSHTVMFATEQPKGLSRNNTLAWVAIGGGGALLLGGVAVLLAREGAIDDINASCPNRLCPAASRSNVESDRDRAELFGPLGVGLGLVGLAAVGVGVYFLVRNPKAAHTGGTSAHPLGLSPHSAGLRPTARGIIVRF